jgi:hypothetical protein
VEVGTAGLLPAGASAEGGHTAWATFTQPRSPLQATHRQEPRRARDGRRPAQRPGAGQGPVGPQRAGAQHHVSQAAEGCCCSPARERDVADATASRLLRSQEHASCRTRSRARRPGRARLSQQARGALTAGHTRERTPLLVGAAALPVKERRALGQQQGLTSRPAGWAGAGGRLGRWAGQVHPGSGASRQARVWRCLPTVTRATQPGPRLALPPTIARAPPACRRQSSAHAPGRLCRPARSLEPGGEQATPVSQHRQRGGAARWAAAPRAVLLARAAGSGPWDPTPGGRPPSAGRPSSAAPTGWALAPAREVGGAGLVVEYH